MLSRLVVLFSVLSYAHADYQVGKYFDGTNSVIYLQNDGPFNVSYIGQLAESRSDSTTYGVPLPSAGSGTLYKALGAINIFGCEVDPNGFDYSSINTLNECSGTFTGVFNVEFGGTDETTNVLFAKGWSTPANSVNNKFVLSVHVGDIADYRLAAQVVDDSQGTVTLLIDTTFVNNPSSQIIVFNGVQADLRNSYIITPTDNQFPNWYREQLDAVEESAPLSPAPPSCADYPIVVSDCNGWGFTNPAVAESYTGPDPYATVDNGGCCQEAEASTYSCADHVVSTYGGSYLLATQSECSTAAYTIFRGGDQTYSAASSECCVYKDAGTCATQGDPSWSDSNGYPAQGNFDFFEGYDHSICDIGTFYNLGNAFSSGGDEKAACCTSASTAPTGGACIDLNVNCLVHGFTYVQNTSATYTTAPENLVTDGGCCQAASLPSCADLITGPIADVDDATTAYCGSLYAVFTSELTYSGTGNENECCTPLPTPVLGCTNQAASNYDATATQDDGSCIIPGCTNQAASNYDATATQDNGSCIIPGCTNQAASNYDATATQDNGSCIILGCTNQAASNYDDTATQDDGSCIIPGCTDPTASNYDATATDDDGSCIITCNGFPVSACLSGQRKPDDTQCTGSDPDGKTICLIADCCVPPAVVSGCTTPSADNYNADANDDDGSCVYDCAGLENIYDCSGNKILNTSATYGESDSPDVCCVDPPTVQGCTDLDANNYNADANDDDGSCEYDCPESEPTSFPSDGCAGIFSDSQWIYDPTATHTDTVDPANTGCCVFGSLCGPSQNNCGPNKIFDNTLYYIAGREDLCCVDAPPAPNLCSDLPFTDADVCMGPLAGKVINQTGTYTTDNTVCCVDPPAPPSNDLYTIVFDGEAAVALDCEDDDAAPGDGTFKQVTSEDGCSFQAKWGDRGRLYFDASVEVCISGKTPEQIIDWVMNQAIMPLEAVNTFGVNGQAPEFTSMGRYASGFSMSFLNHDGTCDHDRTKDYPVNAYTFTATRDGSTPAPAPVVVSGCMDDAANNYNADATQDDPSSCTYSCSDLAADAADTYCTANKIIDQDGTYTGSSTSDCCIDAPAPATCDNRRYDNYGQAGACACDSGRTFVRDRCVSTTKPSGFANVDESAFNTALDNVFNTCEGVADISDLDIVTSHNSKSQADRRADRRDLFRQLKQQRSVSECSSNVEDVTKGVVDVSVDDWLPLKRSLTKGKWNRITRVKLLAPKTDDACAIDISALADDEAFDCVHENDGDECVACDGSTKLGKVSLVSGSYTCECWDGSWQSQSITTEDGNDYCVCGDHAFGIDSLSGSTDDCNVTNGDGSTCTGCTDPDAQNYDAGNTIDDGSCTYLGLGETCSAPGQCESNDCGEQSGVCECIEVGQKVHMADGSLRAVEHLRPGDVLRTPEGHTTVRSTRRGGRHLSAVHDVECAGNRGAITGNHAYHCEGEWRLPQETHRPRALEGTTEVVAIETDNFCEDRLILESGLEVETWDGRGVEEWRPHSYENGRRLRCTLKGSWRDRVLKRVDSKN